MVSIGLEEPEDVIAGFKQAIEKAGEGMKSVRETMLGLVVAVVAFGWGRPAAEAAESDAAPAVARLLSELIRIDSSNPPGETEPVATLLKARFDAAGIESEIVPTRSEIQR